MQTRVAVMAVIVEKSESVEKLNSVLHEYGKLPERSCKIVEYAVPVVFFARKIINPYAFGQVNAVTDIISLLVSFGCLIDRSNQKIRPV